MSEKESNFIDVVGEFNAGIYLQQLDGVIKQVALSVINHGDKNKKGNITLTIDMSRLSDDSEMVNVEHKWAYRMPTKRGKIGEENTTNTPMVVGPMGQLTIYPLTQTELFDESETKIRSIK
jgi:hypothetical protein